MKDRTMDISALTSSLPASLPEAVQQLASMEFEWIDVPPSAADGSHSELIQMLGLKVGCVGLERDPPKVFDLASHDQRQRAEGLRYFCQAIQKTAELQAPVGYLTPPLATDQETRKYWCDSLVELGDHAGRCGVEVCIEHFPGRLVPTVESTLELLDELNHTRLQLLIDVGHCLISGEDLAEAIRASGPRLGYVHFDDNDGQEDLHWGLLTGAQLRATIVSLQDTGYRRTLCLEFNATPDSETHLRNGKLLLEQLTRG